MRELISGSHPGLVTKEDLAQVESRLDQLLKMMDAIEDKLGISFDDENAENDSPGAI